MIKHCFVAALAFGRVCYAFAPLTRNSRRPLWLLDTTSSDEWCFEEWYTCTNSQIQEAASFLVDYFWLRDDRNNLPGDNFNRSDVLHLLSEELARTYIVEQQLRSVLIWRRSSQDGSPLGLMGLAEIMWDSKTKGFWSPEDAMYVLDRAVSNLNPLQKLRYMNATPCKIAQDLLPGLQQGRFQLLCVVCVLSVAERRQGIGVYLCHRAEAIAKEKWGYDTIHLKVEADNPAAVHLYQNKLGYKTLLSIQGDSAVRLDKATGEFISVDGIHTLFMSKDLE